MITALFKEFKSSIKSPDTEEKLDLVLYRPFGFIIAKISNFLLLTPSMLSLMGLISGLVASIYFYQAAGMASNTSALILGSFYFIISGIFDSADGQLARIANLSTPLGLILDGICDSLVTIALYVACSWPFLKLYGPSFGIIMCLGLYLHSCQCAILDFYHREYLYFGYGKTENDNYWNPGVPDGQRLIEQSTSKKERLMNSLRLTWIKKQQFLTSRPDLVRQSMRLSLISSHGAKREQFMMAYRQHNRWLLPFWRLVGVNAHTFLMILFIFLGRFDLYIALFDLLALNLIILFVGLMQKSSDQKLFKQLGL